jgi:protein-S-isoprenylcysteine O-methyltransferase Ste14
MPWNVAAVAWTPGVLTWCAWILFWLFWLGAALKSKRSKRRETWVQRLGYLLPLIAASLLLSSQGASRTWLARALYDATATAQWAGFALVLAGIAFAFWARWHLGANWSGTVTLKEGHELIRSGPYRFIRHPIYTGLLLSILGTVIQIAQVRGFLAFFLVWVCLYAKARREESFLRDEFGDRFAAHVSHTGMFLPKFS